MTNLPQEYIWLLKEPGPKMILEFLKIYGITEVPGANDNPVIIDWARQTGVSNRYTHDSIAWCGLTMAILAKRAGKDVNFDPLWALNWAKFGKEVNDGPKLGDVLVFQRDGGGHVGLYVGVDSYSYHVAGGNQSDQVNIVRKAKSRIYAVRRPIYTVQPANVRKIILSPNGEIDNREA